MAQDGSKRGGLYLLTTEPTFYLKKTNTSRTVTYEKSLIDKKRRLGVGVYGDFLLGKVAFFIHPMAIMMIQPPGVYLKLFLPDF
jgi:hypothetical protein